MIENTRDTLDDTEELKKLKVLHKIDIENNNNEFEHKQEDKTISSCCFKMKIDGLNFMAKFTVSLIILTLSAYQLITLVQCQYQMVYTGLIGLVVGHWLKL